MSFKAGDLVLTLDPWFGEQLLRIVSFRQSDSEKYAIFSDLGFFRLSGLRHATPEEIAAGYRIDHCVEATKKVELFGNSEELEVLEMIDVSPNCEVSEI